MGDFEPVERNDDYVAQLEMQYETLREELANCTRMPNEFSTFSMTALAAVLAFAFSTNNPILFLVPFVLIIPLSSKSLYYRKHSQNQRIFNSGSRAEYPRLQLGNSELPMRGGQIASEIYCLQKLRVPFRSHYLLRIVFLLRHQLIF